MFNESKVLMVQFERHLNIIGLILNRSVTLADGKELNIGGPCELGVFSIF